jgi:hypothetical protein
MQFSFQRLFPFLPKHLHGAAGGAPRAAATSAKKTDNPVDLSKGKPCCGRLNSLTHDAV